MTPFEALREIRRDMASIRMRLAMQGRIDTHDVHDAVHVRLCDACASALVAELDSLFPPVTGLGAHCLHNAQVMGCTFSYGTPKQCALHAFVREEAPCPSN